MESVTPIDAPLNWLECSLKWLGTYKDGFSVVVLLPAGAALLVSAMWTLSTWKDQRERELLKPIIEQHIKVTTSIYELIAKMDVEKDVSKLRDLSSQFWSIYYGSAREFLTPESFEKLSYTAQFVAKCVDKISSGTLVTSCDLLRLSITGFAMEARVDISSRILKDGLTGIAGSDPMHRRK